MPAPDITLRPVQPEDLEVFYHNNKDPEAVWMATETVTIRTIEYQGEVAGLVLKYEMEGDAEVSYWIGRGY